MKSQTTGLVLCALLLSTFGHEYRARRSPGQDNRIKDGSQGHERKAMSHPRSGSSRRLEHNSRDRCEDCPCHCSGTTISTTTAEPENTTATREPATAETTTENTETDPTRCSNSTSSEATSTTAVVTSTVSTTDVTTAPVSGKISIQVSQDGVVVICTSIGFLAIYNNTVIFYHKSGVAIIVKLNNEGALEAIWFVVGLSLSKFGLKLSNGFDLTVIILQHMVDFTIRNGMKCNSVQFPDQIEKILHSYSRILGLELLSLKDLCNFIRRLIRVLNVFNFCIGTTVLRNYNLANLVGILFGCPLKVIEGLLKCDICFNLTILASKNSSEECLRYILQLTQKCRVKSPSNLIEKERHHVQGHQQIHDSRSRHQLHEKLHKSHHENYHERRHEHERHHEIHRRVKRD